MFDKFEVLMSSILSRGLSYFLALVRDTFSSIFQIIALMEYRPLVSTAGVGRKLASYLTWSFSPNLARYFPVTAPGACDLVQILLYTCTMQLVKIHPPGHLADCTLYT